MKSRLPRARCCLFLLLTPWLHAADPLPAVAKAPNSTFGAGVATTIQYAHEDIWEHTTEGSTVVAAVTNEVVPGQRIDVVVSFGGMAQDKNGNVDVTFDVKVTKPDGTDISAGTDLVARQGPVSRTDRVYHPKQFVNLAFSPLDDAGLYRLVATVKDRVANQQVQVGQDIRLLPDSSSKALPANFNADAANEWLTHYYLSPDPRMALPVLQWLSRDEAIAGNPNAWPTFLGAYEMILRDNPWLLPTFRGRLVDPATPKEEKSGILYVLAYVFRNDARFSAQLPSAMRPYFDQIRNRRWPDGDAPIIEGKQLDILWGRFFATGAYAPLQAVAKTLDYHIYHGRIEEYKKLANKPAVPPVEVFKEAVFSAALWSLRANASKQPLVHDYCAAMLRDYQGKDNDLRLLFAIITGAQVQSNDGKVIDFSRPPENDSPATITLPK